MTSLPSPTQTEDYIQAILKAGAAKLTADQLKEALTVLSTFEEKGMLTPHEKYYLAEVEEEMRQRGLIFSVHIVNDIFPEGELLHYASRKALRKALRSYNDSITNYWQPRPRFFELIIED